MQGEHRGPAQMQGQATQGQPAQGQGHPGAGVRVVEITAEDLRPRLAEAVDIYVTAMRYPPGTAAQRRPLWLEHMLRAGWKAVAAWDGDDLVGIGYGYLGAHGQWWHEEVSRGLRSQAPQLAADWMTDYFELTELHVHPSRQGAGIGNRLIELLLTGVPAPRVLLSTPEGPTRAWSLYRRIGFVDLLRDYRFTGDPRPFAVLGRELPLEVASDR